MIEELRDRLIDGLVACECGESPAEELIGWAVRALQAGEDTPVLRVVAGLVPGEVGSFEVVRYFSRAAHELGIRVLTGEALRRAYIPVACRALLRGELPPREALDRIHRRVVSPLGHPADLMRWCYLWEGNGPECESLDGPNTEYVLAEAQRWTRAPDDPRGP